MTNLDSIFKSRDITLPTKVCLVRLWFFLWSCMDVRVGLWRKVSAEEWCFWTVVLEKTLESPLDCKEIQPVHSEGDQPWDFFVGNDAKAETPVLWPPHAKSWLTGKDSDARRDWGQGETGMTENEMAGWHQRLDGREFEWTPGVGDGQGGLGCCDSWGCKQSDMTERLKWTERREEKTKGVIIIINLDSWIMLTDTMGRHNSFWCVWRTAGYLGAVKTRLDGEIGLGKQGKLRGQRTTYAITRIWTFSRKQVFPNLDAHYKDQSSLNRIF